VVSHLPGTQVRREASLSSSSTAMWEKLFGQCGNYRFGNEGQNRLLALN
jgi:hypothetical protein